MPKKRLDQMLVDGGYFTSRERAKAVIMAGEVYINGQKADKPGVSYDENASIEVRGGELKYVSRGGLKLERALEYFKGDVRDKVCIDCGASTGGFTDVMLQNGARHVYSVDVGYGQLAWSLRQNERVTVMERTNVRYITPDMFPDRPEVGTIDVSFISTALIFPALSTVLAPGGTVYSLIKPQFEAGKDKVGKKGVVREKETHAEVIEKFIENAEKSGFSAKGVTWSPIKGPEGNIEFLAKLVLDGMKSEEIDVMAVVDEAHGRL